MCGAGPRPGDVGRFARDWLVFMGRDYDSETKALVWDCFHHSWECTNTGACVCVTLFWAPSRSGTVLKQIIVLMWNIYLYKSPKTCYTLLCAYSMQLWWLPRTVLTQIVVMMWCIYLNKTENLSHITLCTFNATVMAALMQHVHICCSIESLEIKSCLQGLCHTYNDLFRENWLETQRQELAVIPQNPSQPM